MPDFGQGLGGKKKTKPDLIHHWEVILVSKLALNWKVQIFFLSPNLLPEAGT